LIAAVLPDYYTRNETDIVVFISYSNTGRGQLADSRHLPRHVQLRETDDVGATFTNERSMLYYGHALSLAGVENDRTRAILDNCPLGGMGIGNINRIMRIAPRACGAPSPPLFSKFLPEFPLFPVFSNFLSPWGARERLLRGQMMADAQEGADSS